MVLPRVSLARMTALIAIVAVDCGLMRIFLRIGGLGGFLFVGMVVSFISIVWLLTRDCLHHFVVGFGLTLWVVVSLVCLTARFLPSVYLWIINEYLDLIFKNLPAGFTSLVPTGEIAPSGVPYFDWTLRYKLVMELLLGLPVVILSVFGGLLTVAVRKHTRPNSSPNLA